MRVRLTRRVVFAVALATAVGAGRWLLLNASVPQVGTDAWVEAGNLGALPDGTAGAALADGRLVVAGGRYADGSPASQIGIYDPVAQSWDDGGQLTTARFGHTATALKDGRVLVAGGVTVNGVTHDIEVYDPNTHESVHLGDMWVPRVNHAAATLQDGTVLIVGGFDGVSFLAYAERINPETGETHSLSAVLGTAREKLTATTMLDGHVLIAGGRNGDGDLAIAEVFNPSNWTIFATGSLSSPRSGHVAVLLPDNNQVLIAGGPSASAELYADWRNRFTPVSNGMAQARTGAIGGALQAYDLAVVAGGGSGSVEYFGYATVTTDRDDYWPGEKVTITGSGWQPGERVTLKISEDADTHNDFTYYATADGQGNISNAEFAPIENEVFHHFGIRFYVTATGISSTALNTFTDGKATVDGTVTNSATGLPVSGATVTCTSGCNGNIETATTDASGNYSVEVNFPQNSATVTLTASAAGFVTQSQPVSVSNSSGPFIRNFALNSTSASTSTAVSSSLNPSTYGTSVTFTATITPSTATGSVQFKDGAADLGGPLTVSAGQAALATNALLAGSHSITAVFTGTGTFTSSTSPVFTQQVDPKGLTITATNQNKVYGTVVTPAGTEFTPSGLVLADTVASVTLNSPGYAATASVAGSPHAITPSAAVGTGLANYTIAYQPGTMTVATRPVTVTADPKTKIYGADDPALTYQLTSGSLVGSDSFSGTLSRVAGENVGPYAIEQGSLTLGTNYAITFSGANLSITPATLTVTAQAKTKEYGSSDPPLTYLSSGFKFSDTAASVLTGTLVRAAGETVAGSPYVIGQGSVVANANYTINFIPSTLSITPATLTVTAQAKTKEYGSSDPPLTYLSSGFKFSDTAASVLTGSLTRVAGETVLGGPYAIQQGSLVANTNYTISFTPASLSITPKPASVTPNPASKEYGASDPPLSGSLLGFLPADGVSADYSRTAGETVLGGPYTISATLSPTGVLSNYNITANTAAFTITTKAASVTPNPASKEYGANDPSLSGSLLGFLPADGVSADYSRTVGETVLGGPYTISATLSPAGVLSNYNITANTAPFTITTKPASVTPDPASKEYGASDPPLSGSLLGFLPADGVTAIYSRTAGETVLGGPYTISATLSPAGVLSNYNITANTAAFTITTKAASVTPDAASKEYGASDPPLSGSLLGFLPADGVTAIYSRTAGETVLGGPYTISATLSPAGVLSNYNITATTAAFTITTKAASVTPDAASKEYGASDPPLSGSLLGFLPADGVSAVYSRTAGETVLGGPYTISATLSPTGVLSNYKITANTAAFTITTKPLVVTANNASTTFGQSAPAFGYSAPGLLSGDTLSGTAAYAFNGSPTVPTNAGSYTLSVSGLSNPNYAITFATGTYTIHKANPVLTWSDPADITYPTALSATQLNASPNVAGNLVYTPSSGTVLNAGPGQTLHVGFTPTDTNNYNSAAMDVLINVLKGNQAINFGALGDKTFGDPPVPVSATGGASGQPVTFSTTNPVICSAAPGGPNAATVTIHAVGLCTVRASQAGTSNYNPAPDVDRSFSAAAWTAQGFHQPVGIPNSVFAPAGTALLAAPPATAAWNSARGGSTIPLKFNVFAAGVERTSTADIVGFVARPLTSCSGASFDDPLEVFETAGATVLRYDGGPGAGGQFIQNWKTPANRGTEQCYRVELTFRDASVLYTFVKLKK